ncbi:MAG: IS3 family transposase [Arenicellales bacterium]|nr:IS3 family transposase [Arenicellales bacterium]
MRKSRYTETQIVRILKEVEGGRQVKEICREYGISDATYYNWKAKYGGMDASDIRKLKELEDENRRLKQMYANLSLEHEALKDVVNKKALGPAEKRELADYMKEEHKLSARAACRALDLSRTVYAYQPDTEKDLPVIEALLRLAEEKPAYGFGLMYDTLRREGNPWNHKRVYRVYKALKLNLRRKGKKRLPNRHPQPLSVPESINQCWSIDFMSDSLITGRRFRTFNVVDDYNREALAIEVDLNLPSQRIIRVLDRIALTRGYPAKMRMDNGPELISTTMAEWAEEHCVDLEFIQPGKPTQNSFVERFNRTFRTEVLDMYVFRDLDEVREISGNWIREYNTERPHQSLGKLTPIEYRMRFCPENSNLQWH